MRDVPQATQEEVRGAIEGTKENLSETGDRVLEQGTREGSEEASSVEGMYEEAYQAVEGSLERAYDMVSSGSSTAAEGTKKAAKAGLFGIGKSLEFTYKGAGKVGSALGNSVSFDEGYNSTGVSRSRSNRRKRMERKRERRMEMRGSDDSSSEDDRVRINGPI